MTPPLLALLAVAAILGLTVLVTILRAAYPKPRVTETLRPPPAEPGRLWPVSRCSHVGCPEHGHQMRLGCVMGDCPCVGCPMWSAQAEAEADRGAS